MRTGLGRRKSLDGPDDHVAHLVREQKRVELGRSGAPAGHGPVAGRVQVDEILDFRGHWGHSARPTGRGARSRGPRSFRNRGRTRYGGAVRAMRHIVRMLSANVLPARKPNETRLSPCKDAVLSLEVSKIFSRFFDEGARY